MSLNFAPSENNIVFDYNDHIMGIGGTVSLSDADPVALRLKRCLEGLVHCSGKVLEIGCGAGRMVKNLKFHCPDIEIHGCDISYKAIHRASSDEQQKANFAVADVQTLPYADESFDIVVGFDIMEHVPDVQRTITETYRVLKKGGRFHIHAPCEGNPFTIYWILGKIGIARNLKRKYAGHIQKLRTKELLASLRKQGYRTTDVKYSWHVIGQLSDLERYVSQTINSPVSDRAVSKRGIKRIFARVLYVFEDLLTEYSVKESLRLKDVSWAMGIHVTAVKVGDG
jgi:ubiquinone/menaquinone biosynthesis C-methylase UbiE